MRRSKEKEPLEDIAGVESGEKKVNPIYEEIKLKHRAEEAKQELKINPIFRDQLPDLPEDKYRKLEKDICEKGCMDPIRTWNSYIIDGHNRHKICTENNVEFRTLSLNECFEDETDVRIWIIDHQDGRRELEPYVRAELQMEKSTLQTRKRNNQHTKGQPTKKEDTPALHWCNGEDEKQLKPCEKLAKESGMGIVTYSQACYIAQNAPEEINVLEKQILEYGVREPLVTWKGNLVDGHHRHKICIKHSLKFPTVEYDFEDELDVMEYIHVHQMARRDLTPFERIEHMKKVEEIRLKRKAKESQKRKPVSEMTVDGEESVPQNSGEQNDKDRKKEVDRQLAEKAGVSHDTIHKASKIIDFGSEELKQQLRDDQHQPRI